MSQVGGGYDVLQAHKRHRLLPPRRHQVQRMPGYRNHYVHFDQNRRPYVRGRGPKRRWAPPSGVRRAYGRKLTRPTWAAAIPRPLVQRHPVPGVDETWQLKPAMDPSGPGLVGMLAIVPTESWGSYTRGFDVSQITGNAIKSRNLTMRVRVRFPPDGSSPKAYCLRVLQCWVKQPLVGETMTSTQGTTGMQDGIVLNFNPHVKFKDHVYQVVQDNIGAVNGSLTTSGAVSAQMIKVISDTKHVFNVEQTTSDDKFQFGTYERLFNFKTNRYMRLFPFTAGGVLPPGGAPDGLAPINNPGLWIPTVVLLITNNNDYQTDSDRPVVNSYQTHFWNNL